MAGFQSGGACYPTAADANQALSYTFKGTLINLGSGPGVVREVASSSTIVALYITPLDNSPELERLIFTDPSACIIPDGASADEYLAVSVVFGVILTAACIIWGVKQLLNLLHNRPES